MRRSPANSRSTTYRSAWVLSGTYEFPFGPGRGMLNRGLLSHIIGGWQISGVATFQSGIPLPLPSGYYITQNLAISSGQNLNHWFNTAPGVWVVQPPQTLRTAPFYSPDVRGYSVPQLDAMVTRIFRITERQQFKFRVSAFNATNSPEFGFPNTSPASPQFGQIPITQTNLPRNIELGFRYSF